MMAGGATRLDNWCVQASRERERDDDDGGDFGQKTERKSPYI